MKTISKILLFVLLTSCITRKGSEGTIEEGSVELDNIEFKYIKIGQGSSPIVVVGSSAYYSKAFSDNILNQYKFYFIDSRHFIHSYTPTENDLESISLSTWADDLEMIRKNLNIKNFTVVGHSVHAQIALEYAHRYPENLSRLVLIGGVPYSPTIEYNNQTNEIWLEDADENRKSILNSNRAKLDSILSNSPQNEHFAILYDLNAPLYWLNPNYDAKYLLNELKTSPESLNKLFSSLLTKEEVIFNLKNLEIPTLIIQGRYDFAIPHTAWEELLFEVQNDRITYNLMENAGHNPHTEDLSVKEFDKIIGSWISKN